MLDAIAFLGPNELESSNERFFLTATRVSDGPRSRSVLKNQRTSSFCDLTNAMLSVIDPNSLYSGTAIPQCSASFHRIDAALFLEAIPERARSDDADACCA